MLITLKISLNSITNFDADTILKLKSAVRMSKNLGNIFKKTFFVQNGMRPLKRVEREFTFNMTTVHSIDNVTRTTVNKMYLPMRGTTREVAGMRS